MIPIKTREFLTPFLFQGIRLVRGCFFSISPNYKLYIAPEKFWEQALEQPPYPSVSTYDAKLWQFVLQDAEPNDYIWNVGKDI